LSVVGDKLRAPGLRAVGLAAAIIQNPGVFVQKQATTSDASASAVPNTRRWGWLAAGVALLAWGIVLLRTPAGAEGWLGALLIGCGLYLVAGAAVPRLLRFGYREVPLPLFFAVFGMAMNLAGGDLVGASFFLVAVIVCLVVLARRRPAAEG
jgi:hypothetical protein